MWQKIETAPKDGTRVLVGSRRVEQAGQPPVWRSTVAWWDDKFRADGWDEENERQIWVPAWTDGTVASWGYEECAELSPTHWMPLPEPPTEQPTSEGEA